MDESGKAAANNADDRQTQSRPWRGPERILAVAVVVPTLVSGLLLLRLAFAPEPVPRPAHESLTKTPPAKSTGAAAWPGPVELPANAGRITVLDLGTRERAVGVIGGALESLIASSGETAQQAAKIAPRLAERFVTALAEETGKSVPQAAQDLIRWLLSRGDAKGGPELREEIFFDADKAELREVAYTSLNKVRSFADRHKHTLVLVRTFADTTASTAHNRILARRRGDAIRDALTMRGGVSKLRVFVSEVGEEELPHITADGRLEPRNRAAEVLVQ